MNRAYNCEQGNCDRAGEAVICVKVVYGDRLGALPAVFGRLAVEFEMLALVSLSG